MTRIRAALGRHQPVGDQLPLLVDPVLLGYAPVPPVLGLGILGLMVFKLD